MISSNEFLISDTLPHPRTVAVTHEEVMNYYRVHQQTYEVLWFCKFLVFDDTPLFPRPLSVSAHIVRVPEYRCDCKLRWGDPIRYFCYTLSGTGGITDASGSHVAPPGHGFLVEVDDPQASYYYPPDATEPWHFLAFTFHGLQAHVMVRALLQQYGPVYQLPLESRIIQRLLGYEGSPQPRGQTSVSQIELYEGVELVTELLIALMASQQSVEKNDHSQDLVRQVIAMITEDVTAGLRVNDVAQRLGVSREHLSRLCHNRLGKPLRTLMLEQRVYRACRLLKETDIPIKTIAEMLGYTAYPNFLSAFKDVMKQTPYEFRINGTLTDFIGYTPTQQGRAGRAGIKR